MAASSYTSFDDYYFLGNTNTTDTTAPTTTITYGEHIDCKANTTLPFFNQNNPSNCFYHEQQQHPQGCDLFAVDPMGPSSYCHPPSDQFPGGIPIPGTAPTTTFSPFSASDDSLYSFSPENDSFFGPSSASPFASAATLSSVEDPYVLDTLYYKHPHPQQEQHQPDLSLDDLLMFHPFSIMDTNEPAPSPPMGLDTAAAAAAAATLSMTTVASAKQPRRPKLHRCPHCPHTSNRANNMKEHILTHDPNRPKKFPCSLCGKRFARKHDMKRHAKSPHPLPLTSADTFMVSAPSC